jgi:hypothetical protein
MMPVHNYRKYQYEPCIPDEINEYCFPDESDEFCSLEPMKHFYASEMIGCRYFCDALDLYVKFLRERAACVLQNDIYPVLSENYGTSDVCIEAAIRRWIIRSWKNPEMRKFFYAASGGEITKRPSIKKLLHIMARTLVFGLPEPGIRPGNLNILRGDEISHQHHSMRRPEKERGPVQYYRCVRHGKRRERERLPFYMSDGEKCTHVSESVSEP